MHFGGMKPRWHWFRAHRENGRALDAAAPDSIVRRSRRPPTSPPQLSLLLTIPTGQEMPVPPSPQYPFLLRSRYCWWHFSLHNFCRPIRVGYEAGNSAQQLPDRDARRHLSQGLATFDPLSGGRPADVGPAASHVLPDAGRLGLTSVLCGGDAEDGWAGFRRGALGATDHLPSPTAADDAMLTTAPATGASIAERAGWVAHIGASRLTPAWTERGHACAAVAPPEIARGREHHRQRY
jgi:hypothetical protein